MWTYAFETTALKIISTSYLVLKDKNLLYKTRKQHLLTLFGLSDFQFLNHSFQIRISVLRFWYLSMFDSLSLKIIYMRAIGVFFAINDLFSLVEKVCSRSPCWKKSWSCRSVSFLLVWLFYSQDQFQILSSFRRPQIEKALLSKVLNKFVIEWFIIVYGQSVVKVLGKRLAFSCGKTMNQIVCIL